MYSLRCCGVKEFDGLWSDPVETLREMCRERSLKTKSTHIIFTSINERGESLRKYIMENKLGQVVMSDTRHNYNSGNKVTVYVFTPNRIRLNAWYRQHEN